MLMNRCPIIGQLVCYIHLDPTTSLLAIIFLYITDSYGKSRFTRGVVSLRFCLMTRGDICHSGWLYACYWIAMGASVNDCKGQYSLL